VISPTRAIAGNTSVARVRQFGDGGVGHEYLAQEYQFPQPLQSASKWGFAKESLGFPHEWMVEGAGVGVQR
jgi:hypothetical protein